MHLVNLNNLFDCVDETELLATDYEAFFFDVVDVLQALKLETTHFAAKLDGLEQIKNFRTSGKLPKQDFNKLIDILKSFLTLSINNRVRQFDSHILLLHFVTLIKRSLLRNN